VFRLASLMWRIRRSTAIETGLLQIQAEMFRERRGERDRACASNATAEGDTTDNSEAANKGPVSAARDLTWSFLRLAPVDEGAWGRLTRYEAVIWREIAQTIFVLDTMRRR